MRVIGVMLALWVTVFAYGQKATEPKPGSPERKAIMDAIRIPFEKQIGGKLIFKVNWLKSSGTWAFSMFEPVRPNGKPVDWSKTKFKEEAAQGVLDSTSLALLQKKTGKWKVVEYAIGPTDYPVEEWMNKRKGVPKSIFPHG